MYNPLIASAIAFGITAVISLFAGFFQIVGRPGSIARKTAKVMFILIAIGVFYGTINFFAGLHALYQQPM